MFRCFFGSAFAQCSPHPPGSLCAPGGRQRDGYLFSKATGPRWVANYGVCDQFRGVVDQTQLQLRGLACIVHANSCMAIHMSLYMITGWWFGCHQFYFPIYLGMSSSQLTNSYFSGVGIQPPTRFILYSYIVALAYIRLIVIHPMNPMLWSSNCGWLKKYGTHF